MAANIPIRNLYYLLCYAWNALEEAALVEVSEEDATELVELFARVLVTGCCRLLRRGLERDYLPRIEVSSRLRGRLHLLASARRRLLHRGLIECEFDELEHGIPANRILKTTLLRLVRVHGLPSKLQTGLREVLGWIRELDPIVLTTSLFRRVSQQRLPAFYRFLLRVCEFLHEQWLPNAAGQGGKFRDFVRDERRMRLLFQQFVRRFYERELPVSLWKIHAPLIAWRMTNANADAERYIPRMETDVCLASPTRRIILDTKYTTALATDDHHSERLKTGHLYQLFAYLRNQAAVTGWERAEGVLLYPAVVARPEVRCELHGHPVNVLTLNLNQPWPGIRAELLRIVGVRS